MVVKENLVPFTLACESRSNLITNLDVMLQICFDVIVITINLFVTHFASIACESSRSFIDFSVLFNNMLLTTIVCEDGSGFVVYSERYALFINNLIV